MPFIYLLECICRYLTCPLVVNPKTTAGGNVEAMPGLQDEDFHHNGREVIPLLWHLLCMHPRDARGMQGRGTRNQVSSSSTHPNLPGKGIWAGEFYRETPWGLICCTLTKCNWDEIASGTFWFQNDASLRTVHTLSLSHTEGHHSCFNLTFYKSVSRTPGQGSGCPSFIKSKAFWLLVCPPRLAAPWGQSLCPFPEHQGGTVPPTKQRFSQEHATEQKAERRKTTGQATLY